MRFGIDRILNDKSLQQSLWGKRVALLAHPASITSQCEHSFDALRKYTKLNITAAFGPQHGMRGEKQDNMIESDDFLDPESGVPVFSLYGTVRRPTKKMMDTFDVILVDLQDVGTRIYTYLTTLMYVLEESAKLGKSVWVLDRPNQAGRPVEGFTLKAGWESFVGATSVPMRHGLTLGELARFIVKNHALKVDLKVVAMENYDPTAAPGFGWPEGQVAWVNPSPNIPTLSTSRCFPGTVFLEGTNLSEGRGTTRPLQIFGAPKIDAKRILEKMEATAPDWLKGCRIRPCYFEPTFHKYKGELCSGFQIHVDDPAYDHLAFKPYRLMLLFFKTLRQEQPGIFAWRQPPYEYENERLPIDLLDGGTGARAWVDDDQASPAHLDRQLEQDEKAWLIARKEFLLYND